MTIGDASGTRLAFVAESTEGTTPSSPTFNVLRYKSNSLAAQKEFIRSEEIRSDRNVSDHIVVGEKAQGTISGELSYGTYDDILAGLLCGAWSSDVLKNGITRNSFTFENTFEQGATDSYLRYKGCLIGGATFSLKPKAIAEISFDVLGRSGDDGAAAALSGATYTAANTNPVLNAANHVSALTLSTLSGTPIFTSLELTITNNLYEQPQIGSQALAGIGLGSFEVMVKGEVYFEDIELYNAIRSGDTVALTCTIGAASGSIYTIEVPSLKLLNGAPEVPGNNQPVILPFDAGAKYNASDAASIKITRAVT